MPTAKSDGLDSAHRQGGQRSQGDECVHAGRAVPKQPGGCPVKNGHPPAISTTTARTSTVQPAVADSGTGQRDHDGEDGTVASDRSPESQWSGSPVSMWSEMVLDHGCRRVARLR